MNSDREFDCYRGDDATRAELKEAAYTVALVILQAGQYPLGSFWLGNEAVREEKPTR